MKNYKLIRKNYQLKSTLKNFFNIYRYKILFLLSIFILGVILGAIIVSEFSADLTEDNLIDNALLLFLTREFTWTNVFFSYLIFYFIIICYAIFINRATFWNLLNICIIFCLGYCFIYNLLICITIFTSFAVILAIIILPIFNFFIMFFYICIVSISWHKYKECMQFGKVCADRINYKLHYLICCILLIIILLIYCLVLNIFLFVVSI